MVSSNHKNSFVSVIILLSYLIRIYLEGISYSAIILVKIDATSKLRRDRHDMCALSNLGHLLSFGCFDIKTRVLCVLPF